jgi:hypothetical protein
MINAFKQIRLTNVNISGSEGRLEVANSGSLAFTTELQATGSSLYDALTGLSGSLSSSNTESLTGVSGTLSDRLLLTGSGLDAKIDSVSGYVNAQISGLIDGAPEALDTLKELAAALGDDENFATTVTTLIGTGLAAIQSGVDIVSGDLSSLSGTLTGNYVTLNTEQTITANKTFAGTVDVSGKLTADGGLEVNSNGEGAAALFVSGSFVGINTEAPTEALDVNGNIKSSGGISVASGINLNSSKITNLSAPTDGGDAVNLAYLTGISGGLQSSLDAKVNSSTQKQFTVLIPSGVENTGISFPGSNFSSAPSVQVTIEGDVIYQTLVKNRSISGFDVYFSDTIQEADVYLNVFASNQ